jgi:hypothetical protein
MNYHCHNKTTYIFEVPDYELMLATPEEDEDIRLESNSERLRALASLDERYLKNMDIMPNEEGW